ncbi:MAG: rhodanese-like domain-containing protein [Pseudomonadota bacterium]
MVVRGPAAELSVVSRRFVVGGGAALAGVAAVVALAPGSAEGLGSLSVGEAHAAASSGDILLVDIRRPDEWAATGVPASGVPIDMRRPDLAEAILAARTRPDQPIAIICARGVRSRRLSSALIDAGIGPIIDVPAGMLGSLAGPGWLRSGLPVKDPPT